MSIRMARLLIALYPRRWKERYGEEFEEMLETGQGRAMMTMGNVIRSAICERTRSWSARTPWVLFGLAPVTFLMITYLVACLILWTGWRTFLPGSATPFVPVHGSAVYFFGAGRLLYYAAPILAGWGIGLTAAYQRSKSMWPAAGLVAVAVLGAVAHVQVSRAADLSTAGQVSLHFDMGMALHDSFGTLYGVAILALTLLPWLIWRSHQSYSRSV